MDHTALNTSLSSVRKVKWLRERMIGSSVKTLLMNHIKDFVLHDEPVDVDKLRKCLHMQVSMWDRFFFLFSYSTELSSPVSLPGSFLGE